MADPVLYDIPVRKDIYSYSMEILLSDVLYTLKFEYNFRDLFWYMSILTPDGVSLLEGFKLVNDYDLLKQYRHIIGLPSGKFIVFDKMNTYADPTIDNFGDTCILIYEE